MPILPELSKAEKKRIEFAGILRRYHQYVPSSYSSDQAVPLVLLLHGGGGLGSQMLRFTGFDLLAEVQNFIVVCPDGVERHWNDGRLGLSYRAHAENIDDVAFVAELADKLKDEFNIDPARIYVAGFSNGGMMTFRLGLELGDKLAGIAAVAANLPLELADKKYKSRLPVLLVHSTIDPIVSFAGGEIFQGQRSLGRVLSAKQTVEFWVQQNTCNPKPRVKKIEPQMNEESINIFRADYENKNNPVRSFTVEGAGHVWPGNLATAQYLPEAKIGRACRGFNASLAIWDFWQEVT
ncbi:MAG: alpha/beta hydrolase fold domain-containing protein [Candidatus Obscuribacterales bacterium]|nr:alpha/beta hydrolase fold domain-containing protein [Candidatus Obscuribacterales bacterium]